MTLPTIQRSPDDATRITLAQKAILAGFALCRCGHPRYNHAALAGPCGHSRCLASCDHYTPQEES